MPGSSGRSADGRPDQHAPGSTTRAAWRRRTAVIARWLHIYLSMVSFAVVLFFSATGLTLNHAAALSGRDRTTRLTGTIGAAAMHPGGAPDDLAIAEQLRRDHNLRGTVTDTRNDPDEVSLSFRGAGYSADATVERPNGQYVVIETQSGVIATLNDLHRGAVTGKAWSWVIDGAAVLLVLVSLTGLALLFFVYKRRVSGLIVLTAGAAVVALIARIFAM